ncbi:MAG: hypothetical protein ACD_39C00250G0003, partial [uncultured bacterium]
IFNVNSDIFNVNSDMFKICLSFLLAIFSDMI